MLMLVNISSHRTVESMILQSRRVLLQIGQQQPLGGSEKEGEICRWCMTRKLHRSLSGRPIGAS